MTKQKEIKYGIEITKPFSKEMYEHNSEVRKDIALGVIKLLNQTTLQLYKDGVDLESDYVSNDSSLDSLSKLVKVILNYKIVDYNFTIEEVIDKLTSQILMIDEDPNYTYLPTYRVKEIAEKLNLQLEKEIIGFN